MIPHYNTDFLCQRNIKINSRMANEITFDKLPQAVGYLTEQVERIYKIVAALQPQTAIDKHRIVEIDEACKITRKGLIPAYKRGKKLYFYEDELAAHLPQLPPQKLFRTLGLELRISEQYNHYCSSWLGQEFACE